MPPADRTGLGSFAALTSSLASHPHAKVLIALAAGPMRLGELATTLDPFHEDVLGVALRELDAEQLVARRVDPGPPLRVLYELTERGAKIAPALAVLTNWEGRRQA